MVADGGCERDAVHRMNQEYKALGVLKNVLSNSELGINAVTGRLHDTCYNTTICTSAISIFLFNHY